MSTATSHTAGYRHIFWDMGGTIVDTYPELDEALGDVVRVAGHHIDDHAVALLTHRSTAEAISTLAEQFALDEALFREAEAALKARWRRQPPPAMPGVREVMSAVSGLNLVVTHRDRSSATSLLETLGIGVDDMICAPDGHPRKPDPAMYVALLERHKLDPSECIGVGDRPIDATAAHAAGMDAALLRTPGLDVGDGADLHLSSLTELLPRLG